MIVRSLSGWPMGSERTGSWLPHVATAPLLGSSSPTSMKITLNKGQLAWLLSHKPAVAPCSLKETNTPESGIQACLPNAMEISRASITFIVIEQVVIRCLLCAGHGAGGAMQEKTIVRPPKMYGLVGKTKRHSNT